MGWVKRILCEEFPPRKHKLSIVDCGMRNADLKSRTQLFFNPQSEIRIPKFYDAGQFFAALNPAFSASSALLNLT